jgi:hypothetical protein
MNQRLNLQLIENGYVHIPDGIDNRIIKIAQENINDSLKKILISKKKDVSEKYDINFYNCLKILPQYELQVLLTQNIVGNNIVYQILRSKKILDFLISSIGPDLEYESNCELNIITIEEKRDYFVKKYHQEFWSGVGIASMMLWIPIYFEPNMASVEFIKKSHTWGHIPHKNREPIKLPNKYETEIIKAKEGSAVLTGSLTLHKSGRHKHSKPRIALPVVVRNFYYPKTGNEDLMEFRRLNWSYYSKLRKILGNPHLSPFRTDLKRTINLEDKD